MKAGIPRNDTNNNDNDISDSYKSKVPVDAILIKNS